MNAARRKISTSTMVLDLKPENGHFYLFHTCKVTGDETLVAANDDFNKVSAAFDRQVELDRSASRCCLLYTSPSPRDRG